MNIFKKVLNKGHLELNETNLYRIKSATERLERLNKVIEKYNSYITDLNEVIDLKKQQLYLVDKRTELNLENKSITIYGLSAEKLDNDRDHNTRVFQINFSIVYQPGFYTPTIKVFISDTEERITINDLNVELENNSALILAKLLKAGYVLKTTEIKKSKKIKAA